MKLNSKFLGQGGIPIDDHADSEDETTYNMQHLPGAKRSDDGSRRSRLEVLTSQVSFSSTGREWSAVTGEGLLVWGLDDDMIFDPISLSETITPAAVTERLASGDYGAALKFALHLNETSLIHDVMDKTPFRSIPLVVRSVGAEHLERMLQCIAQVIMESPHIEFYLQWCLDLLQCHGKHIEMHRAKFMRALRATHKSVLTQYDSLRPVEDNQFLLDFIANQSKLLTFDTS
jgi:periodic tryptophan protein 2